MTSGTGVLLNMKDARPGFATTYVVKLQSQWRYLARILS